MKKIKVLLALVLSLYGVSLFAQNITVKGVVTDAATGEPLSGAAILVKGTPKGTVADDNGRYTITVPANATLGFTTIGFKDAEVEVNGRTEINVSLQTDSELLEETIVVAYGTATRSSFTGSAAVVDSKTIESHVATSVTSSLAGTTPGVQILSSTGDPASGGASTIRIRGIGSMSASNDPLIILDGMPYDGSISDINPNDVDNISVLKDAAASAIYGARGANGVVMITTKRAKAGEAVVKFDGKWGSNSRLVPQYDVITSPAEYFETHYKMMFNSKHYSGASDTEAYAYADNNIYNQNNGGLGYQIYTLPAGEKLIGNNFKINPNARLGYSDGEYFYTPDDWYNEVFHNSFRQEYNVSVSGSKDNFNYYASFGYLNDGGIVDNSGYKRYTGRVNADYQVKKWLKLTTNIAYSHSDSQTASYSSSYGSSGNIFYITNMMAPIYPLYVRDAEGKIMYDENGLPVYDANQTNFTRASFVGNAVRDNAYNRIQSYADVVNAKGGILLTPFKGFTLQANLGIMADNTRTNELVSRFAGNTSMDGIAYAAHSRYFTVNQQYLAEYKTDFNGSKHNLDVLAGFEQYKYKSQGISGQNDHLFNPFIGELNNADGTDSKQLSSSTSDYMTMGFFGRLQYDYAGKYFVGASYRRDASSRFAQGHRWGDFGSASFAWLINKENWFNVSWVDLLKLKVSYGVQGNDNLNSSFPYADQYTHSYNSATDEYSISLAYKGNENLTWESSHSFNYGVDFSLFDGKLNGTIEGFNRATSNLLYSKDVPLSSGNPTGYMPVNVGSISNVGVEASLDGIIFNRRNFKWTWNLNLSHYKNKITSLDESVAKDGIKGSYRIYTVGGSLYEAYVRKFAGVNKDNGKALWYYEESVNDASGKKPTDEGWTPTYETKTTETFSKASQYDIGCILPKLYGGLGMGFNFYGVDIAFQLSYQLGGKYYDGTYQALMHTDGSVGSAWHKDILNAWSETNRDSNIPRLDGDSSVSQTACDCFFVSSNYLSLNNVTIGYSLPEKLLKKLPISGLRIYVSGENLAVLTARQGIDPRYSMGLGGMTAGSGLNSGAYSAMRNVTGGITLTF